MYPNSVGEEVPRLGTLGLHQCSTPGADIFLQLGVAEHLPSQPRVVRDKAHPDVGEPSTRKDELDKERASTTHSATARIERRSGAGHERELWSATPLRTS